MKRLCVTQLEVFTFFPIFYKQNKCEKYEKYGINPLEFRTFRISHRIRHFFLPQIWFQK